MTAGTVGAVTATIPTVAQHLADDNLTVTLDLSGQPDLLVRLARALRRTGTMRSFAALGMHESHVARQLALILAEPLVLDALTLTFDETGAVDLAKAIDDASIARHCDRCGWRYAVADGLCGPCQPEGATA